MHFVVSLANTSFQSLRDFCGRGLMKHDSRIIKMLTQVVLQNAVSIYPKMDFTRYEVYLIQFLKLFLFCTDFQCTALNCLRNVYELHS